MYCRAEQTGVEQNGFCAADTIVASVRGTIHSPPAQRKFNFIGACPRIGLGTGTGINIATVGSIRRRRGRRSTLCASIPHVIHAVLP
mmetsp:Transcript_16109/g.44626  ORF Transcript_16109/g.44626 Transcript_16109/m.44626 type:complete len:87 (-) Transcript_16109:318-578(-)